MKRFWKATEAVPESGGWTVRLDGKPLRTPLRECLVVPTEHLAKAIAVEWSASGDQLDPRVMPLTGLANAAIDRVRPDARAFGEELAKYAESDLVCYRAQAPRALAARQAESWDPLLAWARRRFDVDFRVTIGIVHIAQPRATVMRLANAVEALDEFRLAGLSPLVTIGGSLIAALAVLENALSADHAWDAVTIDERWQLEQWGADAEAQARLEHRRCEFLTAARFLDLLGS